MTDRICVLAKRSGKIGEKAKVSLKRKFFFSTAKFEGKKMVFALFVYIYSFAIQVLRELMALL
jgi:hypothetical protein